MIGDHIRSRAIQLASNAVETTRMVEKPLVKVKLKSFEHVNLGQVAREIVGIVRRTGGVAQGPIPLPTRIEKFTVNRSPHIDKKSREQFEIRTHKRLIQIVDPPPETIDMLSRMDLGKIWAEISIGKIRIRNDPAVHFTAESV